MPPHEDRHHRNGRFDRRRFLVVTRTVVYDVNQPYYLRLSRILAQIQANLNTCLIGTYDTNKYLIEQAVDNINSIQDVANKNYLADKLMQLVDLINLDCSADTLNQERVLLNEIRTSLVNAYYGRRAEAVKFYTNVR